MVPPGTKVIVHDKSTKQLAWGYHGKKGDYISPTLEHYRCIQCLMPVPRVLKTICRYPHTIIQQNAQGSIPLPLLNSNNKRILHICNKASNKKEILHSLLNNQLTRNTWFKASNNEYGCIMDDNDTGIIGTQTMEPIFPYQTIQAPIQ